MELPSCSRCIKASMPCTYRTSQMSLPDFVNSVGHLVGQMSRRTTELEDKWKHFTETILPLAYQKADESDHDDAKGIMGRIVDGRAEWIMMTGRQKEFYLVFRQIGDLLRLMEMSLDFELSFRSGNYGINYKFKDKKGISATFAHQYSFLARVTPGHDGHPRSIVARTNTMLITSLHSTLSELFHTFLTCFPLYLDPNPRQFLKSYYEDTMDPLLKWAILSWASAHVFMQHRFAADRDLPTIARFTYERTRKLLEDRFDQPSFVTVLALLCVYVSTINYSERFDLLELAVEHSHILLSQHTSYQNVDESLKRAILGVSLVYETKSLLCGKRGGIGKRCYIGIGEWGESIWPGPYPHEGIDGLLYLSARIYALRTTRYLARLALDGHTDKHSNCKTQKSQQSIEARMLEIEKRFRQHHDSRPDELKIDVLEAKGLSLIAIRSLIGQEMVFWPEIIQIYIGVLEGKGKRWQDGFRVHAETVCKEAAIRILTLWERGVVERDLCEAWVHLAPFELALRVFRALAKNKKQNANSEDPIVIQEELGYMIRLVRVLEKCRIVRMPHAVVLLQRVIAVLEEFRG
ncbi:uncharacterized protein VTP21DRAFT_3545 [Calcarisporiella thermophila]|uniref:uncharacterized protein n=1 Tax=Calcarisporiella thermophila TaxID=911321 RepID=UPI00374413B5